MADLTIANPLNREQKDCDKDAAELVKLLNANKMGKHDVEKSSQWTKTLTFAAYGSTLGSSLPLGYNIGGINSLSVYMTNWCNETIISRYNVYLSEEALIWLWSSIISIFLIGGAVGSVIGASLANKFGRRFTFYICGYLLVISAASFYFCRLFSSVELLLLGRFLCGFACGINISGLPMYHSEMATLEHRGTLGVFCPIGLTTGVVVGQLFSLKMLFGTEELWHVSLSLFVIPVIIFYIPYKLYPESPKWLYVMAGKRDEAENELKRLRCDVSPSAIAAELETLDLEAIDKSNDGGSSYCQVLGDPKLRLPTVIVCAYQGGQQLSGINAIFFYSVSIFCKAGLSIQQASFANLGAGSLNLAIALLGPYLMGHFNRRPLMLLSTSFCTAALFFFGIFLNYSDNVSWFPAASIACMLFYIFFFQFGVGPIPFFIGSELFEVAPRPVAMSLGGLSSQACSFVVSMAFPILQNLWGGFVFMPFSLTCLLLFLLTWFYLPETRDRDVTDIALLVANGFKSKVR